MFDEKIKQYVSKEWYADVQVDNVLRNVINWKSFDLNYLEQTVANNGAISLLIKTWNSVKMHFKVTIASEWKALYKSYIGWTYSWWTAPDNNKLSILKRNATSNYISDVTVKYNPTITTAWTQRANLLILGWTGPQSTWWTTWTSESIIWPNSEFLIRLTNVSGQNKDMQLIIEWYEELI